jgi:hypothetical protein
VPQWQGDLYEILLMCSSGGVGRDMVREIRDGLKPESYGSEAPYLIAKAYQGSSKLRSAVVLHRRLELPESGGFGRARHQPPAGQHHRLMFQRIGAIPTTACSGWIPSDDCFE